MQEPLTTRLKKATLKLFKEKKHACYVLAQGRIINTDNITDLETLLSYFVNHPKQRTALLLGDSGGGKTLFGQCLVRHLWEQFDKSIAYHRIPLWIDLTTIKNPEDDLLSKHLEQLGFDKIECAEIKKNDAFFLVLDAADEIVYDQNLFKSNHFYKNDIKILVTFCSSALRISHVPKHLFGSDDIEDFVQYEILPFSAEQRRQYLQLYLRYHKLPWSVDVYSGKIKELIDVEELIANPYYFYLTLKILPALIIKNANEKNPLKRLKLTRQALYSEFVEQRFRRQQEKLYKERGRDVYALLERKNQNRSHNSLLTLIDLFREYCQKLAQAMHERDLKQVTYNPKSDIKIELSPDITLVGSVSPIAVVSSKQFEQNGSAWIKEFFDENDKELEIIRSGCPIRQVRLGQWAFFHASLLDYFIADHLFNSAILDAQILTGHNLNAGNLQNCPEIIHFLVDRAAHDPEFVTILFQIIELSKHEPHAWKAAANAITILNYAGIMLVDKDRNYRRIRIGGVDENNNTPWGADLSHSHLYGMDMSEADCRYVDIHQTNLGYVKLIGACMTGAMLREKVPLKGRVIDISEDGSWFVISENRNSIFESNYYYVKMINTSNFKLIREISVKKDPDTIILNPSIQQLLLRRTGSKVSYLMLCTKNETYKFSIDYTVSSFSPDGRLIAVGPESGGILLINTGSGNTLKTFKTFRGRVNPAKFSPDGQYLVCYDNFGALVVNINTGEVLTRLLDNHFGQCNIFFNDQQQLITFNKKSRLITIMPNKLVSHPGANNIAKEGNTKIFSVLRNDKQIDICGWDKDIGCFDINVVVGVTDFKFCFSSNYRQLATMQTGYLKLWNTLTGTCTKQAEIESEHVAKMSYSPKGDYLAISSTYEIILVRVQTLSCIKKFVYYSGFGVNTTSTFIFFHPTKPLLLSGNHWCTYSWDIEGLENKNNPIRKLYQPSNVQGNEFSTTLLNINLSELEKIDHNKLIRTLNSKGYAPNEVYVSLDKKYFAGYFKNFSFGVWEAESKQRIVSFIETEKIHFITLMMAINAVKKQLAYAIGIKNYDLEKSYSQAQLSSSSDIKLYSYKIKIINFDQLQPLEIYHTNPDEFITSLLFTPNGLRLLAYTSLNNFLIFDTATGRLLKSVTNNSSIVYMDCCDNSKQLIAIHKFEKFLGRSIYLLYSWDIDTLTSQAISDENQISIGELCDFKFHPSGKYLAVTVNKWVGLTRSKSSNHLLGIWDIAEKKWNNLIDFPDSFHYQWLDDNKLKIFHSQVIQSVWQIDLQKSHVRLLWNNAPSEILWKNKLDITNCYDLSPDGLALLQFTGHDDIPCPIIGTPNTTRKVADVLKERNSQVFIPSGEISVNNSQFRITTSYWMISLVRKSIPSENSVNPILNRSAHVWLLIQGITENHYSYVKEIHLFLDQSKRTYFGQSVGTGMIQIRDKSPRDLESQMFTKNYVAKSWNVSKDVVMAMLANIEQDQKQEIDYLMSGYSPGLFGRRAYSCLTWAEEHLRRVGIEVGTSENDLFCAFPMEHLPGPIPPASSVCLIS